MCRSRLVARLLSTLAAGRSCRSDPCVAIGIARSRLVSETRWPRTKGLLVSRSISSMRSLTTDWSREVGKCSGIRNKPDCLGWTLGRFWRINRCDRPKTRSMSALARYRQFRGSSGLAGHSGGVLGAISEANHQGHHAPRCGRAVLQNGRFREEKENPLAHSPRSCDRF
jgi:hypothetical protein